jgi:hypothetical protein
MRITVERAPDAYLSQCAADFHNETTGTQDPSALGAGWLKGSHFSPFCRRLKLSLLDYRLRLHPGTDARGARNW